MPPPPLKSRPLLIQVAENSKIGLFILNRYFFLRHITLGLGLITNLRLQKKTYYSKQMGAKVKNEQRKRIDDKQTDIYYSPQQIFPLFHAHFLLSYKLQSFVVF